MDNLQRKRTPLSEPQANMAMTSEEVELALLSALSEAEEPLGAVALSFELQEDVGFSQATIGRKLKEFDMRGLTERVGYKGRVLTTEGEAYLKELIDAVVITQRSEDFLHTLSSSDGEMLIQVLEARRALEREIVRLATLRMEPGEIKELETLIKKQRQAVEHGETGTYENVAFHEALSRMARNQILAGVLQLVRSQSKLVLMVDVIRQQVGGVLVKDHERIMASIRAGDPHMAAQAMSNHIDRLIDDVRKYLEFEAEEELAEAASGSGN